MKEIKSEIIDKIASEGDGLRVPEGYFEDFATRMSAQLPFREELDLPVAEQERMQSPRSRTWMRVRPYVYMAAMFAGAWCLIKMFTLMGGASADVSIENYPALSLALEDEQFVDEYVIDGVSTYDIMEDSYLQSIGVDPEAQAGALDYELMENNIEPADEAPSYIRPTDGDYSSAPYTQE